MNRVNRGAQPPSACRKMPAPAARSAWRAFALVAALGMALPAAWPAFADVYIWIDPRTGKKSMSNYLPTWLRDAQPGQKLPKYEIWRDGRQIDLATALGTPQPAPPVPLRSGAGQPGAGQQPGAPGTPGGPVEPPYNDDD